VAVDQFQIFSLLYR